jgi:predicted AlkP superfamily pyrophosphatase or phosphodiesterase
MTTANQLERIIRDNRLLNLPVSWQDEIIYPYYHGFSIINITRSILALLGASVENPAYGELNPLVWGEQVPEVERVIFFLCDGMGYKLLQELVEEDAEVADLIATLTDGRGLLPLTSVAPSTTAVALPAIWTAQPPGVSGMVGSVQFLREASVLADILAFRPSIGKHANGSLSDWGIDADNFVSNPVIAHYLDAVGVSANALVDYKLYGSGLSRIMHRGNLTTHIHLGYSDMFSRASQVLQETVGKKAYINVYNPALDTISHGYGAKSPQAVHELKYQLRSIRDAIADPALRDGKTLVVITADHGHADVHQAFDIPNDPKWKPIYNAMRSNMGADSRFAYLYLREGTKSSVIDVLEAEFSDQVAWVDRQTAIESGLFGDGNFHPDLEHRIGDLILIPRLGIRLTDPSHLFKHASLHSGLSDREMFVPFIWRVI